jgi:protocatechuate 3,4-dioxygenase beta subunit
VVDSTRFLRGVQVTNQDGVAEFGTIYPGWYAGRTIHIHLKVHLGGSVGHTYQGGRVSHTGQLFLPEGVTASIANLSPYRTHTVHRTSQKEDHVFLSEGGGQSVRHLERLTKGSDESGFVATVTLAVDPDASPTRF